LGEVKIEVLVCCWEMDEWGEFNRDLMWHSGNLIFFPTGHEVLLRNCEQGSDVDRFRNFI
jgi:hypothetical protein